MSVAVTIPYEEYDALKRESIKSYKRGYKDGLDTARNDFAEANAHKNELLRTVEVLEDQLDKVRAALAERSEG